MFDRLFGEGQELQFNRLKVMVPISLVLVIAMVIYGMVSHDSSWIAGILIVGFVWGIRYVPKFIFHKSIGNLFAENIFSGVAAMFGMLILSCAFGVVIMVLGILRFIFLLVIRSSRKS